MRELPLRSFPRSSRCSESARDSNSNAQIPVRDRSDDVTMTHDDVIIVKKREEEMATTALLFSFAVAFNDR